jgi:hypothetical protein
MFYQPPSNNINSLGRRPGVATSQTLDWKTQVQKVENLNAPRVEYEFSNSRRFLRMPGQTGLYNE